MVVLCVCVCVCMVQGHLLNKASVSIFQSFKMFFDRIQIIQPLTNHFSFKSGKRYQFLSFKLFLNIFQDEGAQYTQKLFFPISILAFSKRCVCVLHCLRKCVCDPISDLSAFLIS